MKFLTARLLTPTMFIFVGCSLVISGSVDAQEFTRSTIPLKSGGSMTSIQSQGQSVNYLSQDNRNRTASAQNAVGSNGGVQSSNQSRSFYQQAQVNGGGSGTYPYPALANQGTAGLNAGFSSQAAAAANSANNGLADFRFERSGIGERPSGALGENGAANANANNRVAQLPQLPAAQAPAAANSVLTNPAAAIPNTLPALSGLTGPNYVNPLSNLAVGYQGYQPAPQAANSVPALNIQFPQRQVTQAARVASNCVTNCCCVAQPRQQVQVQQQQQLQLQQLQQQWLQQQQLQQQQLQLQQFQLQQQSAQQQQPQTGVAGFQGFQLQPNIGTPQLGLTNNNNLFNSLLGGSGGYTPLFQFRNLSPGTYLGQGLIGQPIAYVDGQPIRNLLRYISP